MRSRYNPLPEDIRKWAYQESALEPTQDWDLILSTCPNDDLYLDLAGDSKCPNQIYFLNLLYRIVGDTVRSNFKSRREGTLRDFIQKGLNNRPHAVHLWAKRSLQLLQEPKLFVYDDWCAGKVATLTE